MRARFDEFVLDLTRRELIESGKPRHLSTKAFQLLELLVKSAPRALTKEELYGQIWGNAFVEEANLPNLVSEVRAALHDDRKQSRFIKTIHGYGYAFVPTVVLEAEVDEKRRGEERLFLLRWGREEFPIRKGIVVVGRGDEADIIIESTAVSRCHARIVSNSEGATIEDLGSKNGTFVRGERLTQAAPLRDGDEIRLGYVVLTFHVSDRHAPTLTAMR